MAILTPQGLGAGPTSVAVSQAHPVTAASSSTGNSTSGQRLRDIPTPSVVR
jgi:hypothetical protein